MFDEIIEKNKNNIINTVSDLIKIPSISIESDSIHPFGIECTNALNYILEIGKSMGFKTKNLNNYCGYIEFGEGEELIGIIGHLDVVPALIDDGWSNPPFSPIIKDNKLFGRGAIDDKGPVISALYAMKAVMDSSKISKRVRLILGLNEEKSWKCIEYYKQNEEWPSIGFSPDANFPAIYAEKGILSLEFINDFEIDNFEILEINHNNNALNVVPKYCAITLKQKNSDSNHINSILNSTTSNIKIHHIDNTTLKIESFGIAAHAAHPELGKNAITNLIKFLINNFEMKNNYLQTLEKIGFFNIESPNFLNNETIEDETGILTYNLATLEYKENKLIMKTNLRVPVSMSLNDLKIRFETLKNYFEKLEINELSSQESLYVDKNSYLVKTLVNIFNKKTGLNTVPIAIGGGTYARAFENFISYGATMPGDLDMCHQVDEYIEINNLILSSKIYAEAIYELAK